MESHQANNRNDGEWQYAWKGGAYNGKSTRKSRQKPYTNAHAAACSLLKLLTRAEAASLDGTKSFLLLWRELADSVF